MSPINLMELNLRASQVTTDKTANISKGGFVNMEQNLTVAPYKNSSADDPQKVFCTLTTTINGYSKAVEEGGEQREVFSLSSQFEGVFMTSEEAADRMDKDSDFHAAMALRFANYMLPGTRGYHATTLELIGLGGYRLPWHVVLTPIQQEEDKQPKTRKPRAKKASVQKK